MGGGVGGEGLVRVGAEGPGPGAASGQVHGAGEAGGDFGLEGFLGGGGEVADGADGAGLVFDLDHDDGVLRAVDGLDVSHEGGEGVLVGFEIDGGAGGHDVEELAFGVLFAGVLFGVGLDPLGDVMVLAVLPGAEPEEDDVEMVLAGLVDDEVDVAEVEFVLRGFDLFPVDGGFDGVDVEGFEGGPGDGKRGGPGAGVVDLRAEEEVGVAIDDEGEVVVAVFEVGNVVGLGAGGGERQRGEEECGEDKFFHKRFEGSRVYTDECS